MKLLSICAVWVMIAFHSSTVAAQNHQNLQISPEALNFILMGDWGRNGGNHQKQVASQMANTAAEASVDFIITAGDNFYPKGVASEFDSSWKYSFEDIYTDYALQSDWYPVLGNHDYGSNPDAQVRYSAISHRWRMPARYYAKQFLLNEDSTQQLLILFIDSTPLIKSYYHGYEHKVHDQDSSAQITWIKKQLSNASKNVKWKLIVGHHPMYTGGGRTRNQDTRSIRRILQPILERYKVDAYLAGHEHSLQHIGPVKGIHHFISGSASERTPARMLPISKFAASEYGFMLFTIFTSKILIQTIDFNGKIIYKTEINK